jgi:phosphohistidine phosphatase SixA
VALSMKPLFLLLTLCFSVNAEEAEVKGDKYWANEVIKGGYILHFRHGNRNRYVTTPRTSETDVTSFDAVALRSGLKGENEDFGLVTCLTEEGKAEAKLIGRAFDILNIKIGPVLSSPSCRARQTSFFAFGTEGKIVNSLLHRTSVIEEQHEEFAKNLRQHIMAIKMNPGENAILSGHVGTLNIRADVLFGGEVTGNMSNRDDTGFVIIKRTLGNRLIPLYMFNNIAAFTRQVIRLPLN